MTALGDAVCPRLVHLPSFIEQRIRHAYRRQRPTPLLPVRRRAIARRLTVLVSRHGSHLAVGVGSVRGKVLVGTLGDLFVAALPVWLIDVVGHCRFREV